MPAEPSAGPAIPLARWASRQLRQLAAETGSPLIAALDGPTLLGERAAMNGYRVPGRISAGIGGSRLYPTRDGGWFALTLLRDADRALLPALFGSDAPVSDVLASDGAIAAHVAGADCAALVAQGRLLGLPVASADEAPVSEPVAILTRGRRRERPAGQRPLVIDLSAIWAGPLLGHLLWLAGATVAKIESPTRPDLIRRDDPQTFAMINQGKASVLADLADPAQRAALVALIRHADFVIESSRPRALAHFGINADALVREVPGLVWVSVTGHGARGEAANWAGIGNDCGVAGGLSRALADVTGEIGYVGDAIADPLSAIAGARAAWDAYRAGEAQRIGLAMSAVTAMALGEERAHDRAALDAELSAWGAAAGRPFPAVPRRLLRAPLRPLGADTADWLPC